MSKVTKKQKILTTALTLFANQGIGNTSTAQIAREADAAEGTLFLHFKNKQGLVDQIYIDALQRQADSFLTSLNEEEDLKAVIYDLGKKIVNYFLKNYDELIFIEHAKQMNLISRDAFVEAKNNFEPINNYLSKQQKQGFISSVDVNLLTYIAWSNLVAVVHYCKQNKKKFTDTMLEPVLNAIR